MKKDISNLCMKTAIMIAGCVVFLDGTEAVNPLQAGPRRPGPISFAEAFHRRQNAPEMVRAKNLFANETENQLINAVKANDPNEVDRLIRSGARVNASNRSTGFNPLMYAIKSNNFAMVQRLVNMHYASVDITTISHSGIGRGWTPLLVAVSEGNTTSEPRQQIVRFLIANGARLDRSPGIGRGSGVTPISRIFTKQRTQAQQLEEARRALARTQEELTAKERELRIVKSALRRMFDVILSDDSEEDSE